MVHSILVVGVSVNIHTHKPSPDRHSVINTAVGSQEICMNIETSFIINLLMLSGWTIYNKHASNGNSSDGQAALVCASIGVALLPSFVSSSRYQPYLFPQVHKATPVFQETHN